MNRSYGPRLVLLLATSCLVGCDPGPPSTTSAAGPTAPHNGIVLDLPDGGFVEVVQKRPTSSRAPLDKELSFYFFLKDGTTPLAPSPTAGTLTVGKKSVELRADGEALVTPPGPPLFYQGDLGGILKVDIAGISMSIPLRIR